MRGSLLTRRRGGRRGFQKRSLCLCVSVFSWHLPCWRGRPLVCRDGLAQAGGGSGLSLWFEIRVSGSSSLAFPCGVIRSEALPRAGVSARCHSLLSGNRDELRRPAQHKSGFPSRKEGNPVERANSRRNRPGRPGGAARWARSLQNWRERDAPARPRGPGAGKVLRKVPM